MQQAIEEGVPEHTVDGIEQYVEQRVPPGDFLQLVFSNDLFGCLGQADSRNQRAIFEICMWIYNNCPAACHGSPEIYANWLKSK